MPIVSHHSMGRSRQSWESKKYSGAFVSCRIHRLAIFIRGERMAAVPPPSSDLLVAVFIVVTACLPTPDGRFASARRGVLFVFPARRPEDGKLRMLSLAAAFSFPISQPRRSTRRPYACLSYRLYTWGVHYTHLQLLARTACHSCKRMTLMASSKLPSAI